MEIQSVINDQSENNYTFDEIMNYPVPKDKELFFLSCCVDDKPQDYTFYEDGSFSRRDKAPLMDDFIKFIDKY